VPDAQNSPTGVPRPAGVAATSLAALGAQLRASVLGPDATVTGITASSGLVRPGDVFAALPGRTGHGVTYLPDALRAGAVAVLTDPATLAAVPRDVSALAVPDVRAVLGTTAASVYGRPSERLAALGVTGTSGKTTTTFLIRAGLAAAGVPCGLIGTVETRIGDDTVATGFTTPEAPELQALLAVMVERGTAAVAMEVSSHALTLGRADGIAFAVGAFTNLSQDHLDFHEDLEDYFAAKARLFDGRSQVPVVVVDDEWGRRLAARIGPDAVTVSTSGDRTALWRAENVVREPGGDTTFVATGPHRRITTGCAIPGDYNVANALLALAVLDAAGVELDAAAAAIEHAGVPGRMERIDAGQPFLAVVDYSHKPDAVERALRALRRLTTGRLMIVLGCGGARDRGKRPVMGEVAARFADAVIVTDDNPRDEDPAGIRQAMLEGTRRVPAGQRADVTEIGDRAEAIQSAVRSARAGDVVLVAGKGHETGQQVGTTVHPFDDRDVLRRALATVGEEIA
jgi:UDP-N-acetylmuramoyl-L-alanyl-D-glutamate--2,6-diaminopimelate ligase